VYTKNLAFDNKEIKLKDYAERFSSHSKANDFIKKQKTLIALIFLEIMA
jgi:hypothetical protein